MPQERYNTQWVRDNGYGLVLPSFRVIQPAVQALIAQLPDFRRRIGAMRNRAVFEIPDILADILRANERPMPDGPDPVSAIRAA